MEVDDIDQFSYDNWMRVPPEDREKCLTHLGGFIPQDVLEKWKAARAEGVSLMTASGPLFHLHGGMQVRNKLREVMSDDQLPEVEYEDTGPVKNWDDFYLGALMELTDRFENGNKESLRT